MSASGTKDWLAELHDIEPQRRRPMVWLYINIIKYFFWSILVKLIWNRVAYDQFSQNDFPPALRLI